MPALGKRNSTTTRTPSRRQNTQRRGSGASTRTARKRTRRQRNLLVMGAGRAAAAIVSVLMMLAAAFGGGFRTVVRGCLSAFSRCTRTGFDMAKRRPLAASLLFAFVLLSSAALWLGHTGAMQQAWQQTRLLTDIAMRHAGFTVSDIQIQGSRETRRSDILRALGVAQDVSMFALDLPAARTRLLGLPWIQEARVGRRWPDRIDVSVVERTPMALWQLDQRLMLIDNQGERIDVPRSELHRYAHLPHIVGPDAPLGAAPILSLLRREQDLFQRVDALVRVAGRRWDIRLKEGILVRLPEEEPEHAWQVLAGMRDEPTLFTENVKVIDMREKGRLVVRSRIGSNGLPVAHDREERI